MNTTNLNKSIPSKEWGEFFDQFTTSNLGQKILIEIDDSEIGKQELIKNAPLLAMIYDRPGKGDNLAIEIGTEEITYAHSIDSPTDISVEENSEGEVRSIAITDAVGTKTLVKLQSS